LTRRGTSILDPGSAQPSGGKTGGVETPQHSVDPKPILSEWLQAARDAEEPMPEAMTLATITPDGWPSARMVILRGLDAGLVFYTDRESNKGIDLAVNPRAAVVMHWLAPAHRQVRVVGEVQTVSDEQADGYWRGRRPEARRCAAASLQSQVVSSRAALEERLHEYERSFPDSVDLPRPGRWSGFRVIPTLVEFWQEAPDGLHDRFRYRRAGDAWEVERLSP
jgi:pyridoxamine 5'-phosphate oxidase